MVLLGVADIIIQVLFLCGNFQFGQPLPNGGSDSFGIALGEIMNARTDVEHPAVLQTAGKALGEGR